jgi:hypothetical protein
MFSFIVHHYDTLWYFSGATLGTGVVLLAAGLIRKHRASR